MRLPNAFAKMACQQGWEPRDVILKNSSGKVWEVKTLAVCSQLYFDDGWKQFREDNCLGAMDFVFFTHVEDNVFNFKICELSTRCEKMKVEDSEEQEKEKGDVDDVMELDKEEEGKQQDGDGDEHDPGQDDYGDEVEEKEEDQQQEDEDGDEHDPSEDDDSEEEEEEEEQQDEDGDDYDPGEKHGKEKYDVIELDDEEEEEEQDEDGDEYHSDYFIFLKSQNDEYDSDDDEEVEEEENTELEERDEEESKLTKKRKSHPKVCKVSSKREIGSSSATKAEDAGHENIDAAMYIRCDHPYFIVKPLNGSRGGLLIPHLIIKDFSLRFNKKITLVCCQCQNIPRNQLRYYHRSLPQLTPVNKKHTKEADVSVWTDGRVCANGWLGFCRKNKFTENDTCICEIVLREGQPIEMVRVHVAKKK
ncbi:B3 domain-containing protein At4g34400-like [Lotus japonicus]|uniref:B3 domain-containing protein At4g34400-like n=1 Tax=Lotus japonicus TaxID=34305 RepID=UPI0025861988|nr:B3 domain-containing protein At4g34400-like [Lotus japonicus]